MPRQHGTGGPERPRLRSAADALTSLLALAATGLVAGPVTAGLGVDPVDLAVGPERDPDEVDQHEQEQQGDEPEAQSGTPAAAARARSASAANDARSRG